MRLNAGLGLALLLLVPGCLTVGNDAESDPAWASTCPGFLAQEGDPEAPPLLQLRWSAPAGAGTTLGEALALEGATLYLGQGETLQAFDAADGRALWASGDIVDHTFYSTVLAPAGAGAVFEGDQSAVRAFDLPTRTLRWEHTGGVHRLALSPNASLLIAAGTDLQAFDAVTGRTLWEAPFATLTESKAWPVFSPDGRVVYALKTEEGGMYHLMIRDSATGTLLKTASGSLPQGHLAPQQGFATRDGTRLVYGALSRSVAAAIVFDAATGALAWAERVTGDLSDVQVGLDEANGTVRITGPSSPSGTSASYVGESSQSLHRTVFNLSDGRFLSAWSHRMPVFGRFAESQDGSSVFAWGSLYEPVRPRQGNAEARFVILALDGETGEVTGCATEVPSQRPSMGTTGVVSTDGRTLYLRRDTPATDPHGHPITDKTIIAYGR